MKEKSNATLRRAASLRCRTDAAIARLGRAVMHRLGNIARQVRGRGTGDVRRTGLRCRLRL